ncbi:MAG: nicotinamide mononucleotide transporter [Bacteroidetes bacterium]|nr:nicotinamide mononucleotide transporter [Bacteroidota bacterium]
MKVFSALLFLLFFQCSFASTYYISPNGNDDKGNGSLAAPWHSLHKATSTITTPGNTIHVLPGTYIEEVRSTLAPGVNIEGEGEASIIQSALREEFVAVIIALSPEGTDGNQHISNIKLDGNKRTTSWAIEIRGRKNFSIHDCIITDFDDRGVVWTGRADNAEGAPGIYATGNSFYNNTLTNCAKFDSYGRGGLNIGGQEGMLIYHNIITQAGRPKGTNGWPIKYYNGGFLRGCKIYDNILTKEAYDGTTWDFAVELFNVSGVEIYNNTITGSIDLNHQEKKDYPYSVYIHHNTIGPRMLQPKIETGITLEYETDAAVIENNHFNNLGTPFLFTPREGSLISNVTVKHNLCENIGVSGNTHQGFAMNFLSGGAAYYIAGLLIDSNQFIANAAASPYYGIGIMSTSAACNIRITNNTFKNFSVAAITANPAYAIDSMYIQQNIFSGNGNSNKPLFIRGMPDNYSFSGNIVKNDDSEGSNPGFNVLQQLVRPMYYEIKNSSVLEFLALIAGLLGFVFLCRENVYVFPMWLINRSIFLFINFDADLYGLMAINAVYILFCIYGWRLWLQRDRKQHRIVRITPHTNKELMLQPVIFALAFGCLFAGFTFYKQYFTPGTLPWQDAAAYAAAATALWFSIIKKRISWYWWIAASIGMIYIYYSRNYLLMTCYHIGVLALCLWGIIRWKKRTISRRSHS